MPFVVDTSAWVEYFLGSGKGESVRSLLSREKLITPHVVLFEFAYKAEKEKWETQQCLDFILARSELASQEFNPVEVAQLRLELRKNSKNAGLIDALILATARKFGAKLVTTDRHFKGFEETVLLD